MAEEGREAGDSDEFVQQTCLARRGGVGVACLM